MGKVDGLLLCAGKGERLRPLTLKTPKPLVPLCAIPTLAYSLWNLTNLKVRKIFVNLHHMQEKLVRELCSLHLDVFCISEGELLGTGGTIKFILENFDTDLLVVANSDAVCFFDTRAFLRKLSALKNSDTVALLVVARGERDISSLEVSNGRVVRIRREGEGNFIFTGFYAVSKKILKYLPSRGCVVRDGFLPALRDNLKIITVEADFFREIGTPQRYSKALRSVCSHPHTSRVRKWYLSLKR